jgi:adenosine kinase
MTVIAAGSVAFDHILAFKGRFADHILPEKVHVINLSFLVDSLERRRGGVAANYAYTLNLLGYPVAILATIGRDGADFKTWLEARGIDCRGMKILKDETTASGFTTIDLDDNQITGYYGGAMLQAGCLGLADAVSGPEAVMIGPNAPDAMLRLVRESRDRGIPWLWDPAHQLPHLSGTDLRFGCDGAWIVIGNDYEIELMQRRIGCDLGELAELAQIVVTTLGRDGSVIITRGREFRIRAAPATIEVDPVGAGDAFRAGLVFGLLNAYSVLEAGRIASVAATYVVERTGTIEHWYSRAEFSARYAAAYGVPIELRTRPTGNGLR